MSTNSYSYHLPNSILMCTSETILFKFEFWYSRNKKSKLTQTSKKLLEKIINFNFAHKFYLFCLWKNKQLIAGTLNAIENITMMEIGVNETVVSPVFKKSTRMCYFLVIFWNVTVESLVNVGFFSHFPRFFKWKDEKP